VQTQAHYDCPSLSEFSIVGIDFRTKKRDTATTVCNGNAVYTVIYIQCESKNPPCGFLIFFPKQMGIFLINFYTPITRSFLH